MLLQQTLEHEKDDLKRKILFLEKCLENIPDGQMRISHSNGCVQYYFRNISSTKNSGAESETVVKTKDDPVCKNKTGTSSGYFYNHDEHLARAIAQRDYDLRLLKELRTRYKAIDRALHAYNRTDPEKVLQSFSPDRQTLIEPSIISNKVYIEHWLAEKYPRKPFGENTPEIYTAKGERVRSKSEKIIADTLFRYNIPYRYEYPLQLLGFGLVHPDFMVLNPTTRKEFFYEHFGMMDEEKYVSDALKKIEAYEKNDIFPGQQLIITLETRTMPLNIRILEKIIRNYFL